MVVLGSSVTASYEIGDNCTFFDGQDIQIEWRLNDDLIPKSQYTNQSSRKSNLTIPCFNTTQGYLSCFVVLHGQAQLVDVIQITAGCKYRPRVSVPGYRSGGSGGIRLDSFQRSSLKNSTAHR